MPNITQIATNIVGGNDTGMIAVAGSISGELGSRDSFIEVAIFLAGPRGVEISDPGNSPADFGVYQPDVSILVTTCRDCDLFLL